MAKLILPPPPEPITELIINGRKISVGPKCYIMGNNTDHLLFNSTTGEKWGSKKGLNVFNRVSNCNLPTRHCKALKERLEKCHSVKKPYYPGSKETVTYYFINQFPNHG